MASSYESARSNVTDTLVYRCCYVTAAAAAAAAAGDGDGGGVADRAIEPIISAGICWRLISFIEHRAGFGSIELRGCVPGPLVAANSHVHIQNVCVSRCVCRFTDSDQRSMTSPRQSSTYRTAVRRNKPICSDFSLSIVIICGPP